MAVLIESDLPIGEPSTMVSSHLTLQRSGVKKKQQFTARWLLTNQLCLPMIDV